jgi:hypothetical protein
MAEATDDDTTFRLLADEWAFTLQLTRSSEPYAMKAVESFLQKGERDWDGRVRYKLWLTMVVPGGLDPSPYEGEFWHSHPECGIHCTIKPWDSSAHRTGPTSDWWKEFDGRQTSDMQVIGIQFNHTLYVEHLWSIRLLPTTHASPSIGGVAATGEAGTVSTEGAVLVIPPSDKAPTAKSEKVPSVSSKPLTPRQKVIVAIVCRRYPNGIPAKARIASLHRLVKEQWEQECRRQGVEAERPPNRDTVKRTLQQASLLP